jgi:hypothetical protein
MAALDGIGNGGVGLTASPPVFVINAMTASGLPPHVHEVPMTP